MSIKYNINLFQDKLDEQNCKLIAVSKKKPDSDILEALAVGQVDFGENQVQELTQKASDLPTEIRWHMIGHLQRNKVKFIAPFVYMIHAVDSERLLREIEKQAAKVDRVIPCLLQIHIADEETKFGFTEEEVSELIASDLVSGLQHVRIEGLMGMATNTLDMDKVRNEFRSLKHLFERLAAQENPGSVVMKELSMGMTSDWKIAIEEGSTMVRVGSAIFGPRI